MFLIWRKEKNIELGIISRWFIPGLNRNVLMRWITVCKHPRDRRSTRIIQRTINRRFTVTKHHRKSRDSIQEKRALFKKIQNRDLSAGIRYHLLRLVRDILEGQLIDLVLLGKELKLPFDI